MGYQVTRHQRVSTEDLIRYELLLRNRHRDTWGDDCPAADIDYLMCEYDKAIVRGIVDYKFHMAQLRNTTNPTFAALGGLYDRLGDLIPFFVARYWTAPWAFKVKGYNSAAECLLGTNGWKPFTEYDWVWFLYQIKGGIDDRARGYLGRLDRSLPPDEG